MRTRKDEIRHENHGGKEAPDHNDIFHTNIHLAQKQINTLLSRSFTYILEFSAAVTSPGEGKTCFNYKCFYQVKKWHSCTCTCYLYERSKNRIKQCNLLQICLFRAAVMSQYLLNRDSVWLSSAQKVQPQSDLWEKCRATKPLQWPLNEEMWSVWFTALRYKWEMEWRKAKQWPCTWKHNTWTYTIKKEEKSRKEIEGIQDRKCLVQK